jgi:hypothetical protein
MLGQMLLILVIKKWMVMKMKKKLIISTVATGVIASTLLIFGFSNSTHATIVHADSNNSANTTTVLTIPNTPEGKAQIQNLMLNSIDYFKTASGSFEYLSKGHFDLTINYQTDVSDNPRTYEESTDLNNSDKSEIHIYDGTTLKMIEKNKKTNQDDVNSVKPAKITKSQRDQFKNSTMKDRLKKINGQNLAYHRMDPSYMGIAKTSLLPENIAMGFLADTTKWQITGTENVAGINTVIIKGLLNDYYSGKYGADNFQLNVDTNTGILLQMIVTNSSGEITEMIKTSSIKINGNLNNNLFNSN